MAKAVSGFAPETILIAPSPAALAVGFVRGLASFGLSVVLVAVLQSAIARRAVALVVLVALASLFLIGLTGLGRIRRDADRSAVGLTGLAVAAMPVGLAALPASSAR